jgi:TetR/AcrR family transcriptional regulator, mexJK operon transcriptional repressor
MVSRDDDRRTQILDAAQEVFAEKSFTGASIKDLARAAGVSPGLLYWYFKDKTDLFTCLLSERITTGFGTLKGHVSPDLPPHEYLPRFGRAYAELIEQPMNAALFKMVLTNTPSFPTVVHEVQSRVIGQVLGTLQGYLQRQIDAGKIRPCNTEMVARTFMGSVVAFLMLRHILQDPRSQELAVDDVVNGIAEVVLRGILPVDAHKD